MKLFNKWQNVLLVKLNTYWDTPSLEIYEATIVKSNGVNKSTYTVTYTNKESVVIINEESDRYLFSNNEEASNYIKKELESAIKNAEQTVINYQWYVDRAVVRWDALKVFLTNY